jgi:hypothetical protein
MKKHFYLFLLASLCTLWAKANTGDTTWVQSFNGEFTNYGNFDTAVTMPSGATTYRKIYLIFTMGEYNCTAGSQYCHQWDYTIDNMVMTPGGDTLELARFISPYATSGTPGFPANWQQHYIFDVTDFYKALKGPVTMRVGYSGYSWGFTGNVRLAFIEGTPERNVLGQKHLWNGYYNYGNLASPIDSNVRPYNLTAAPGTVSSEMKLIITGHGADTENNCCEFSNNGTTYYYNVAANNKAIATQGMDMNCGWSELYPQGGTWLYYRAGNWCPGGLVSLAQYKMPGVAGGDPYTTDVYFDDSYNGVGSYGGYAIAASMFDYTAYNKTLDASLEDVIAPTNFEWYRRENPRASVPVVKVRNTGGTLISSILFQYGVKDSAMSQYIWTGALPPSADTTISLPALPALTNLSLSGASGTYGFIAQIQQVNGQTDNDPSNDTITSSFAVAPVYPASFVVRLQTSSIGANGNLGQSPADASWQITDQFGNIVASRTNANVTTTYSDTVYLNAAGFYALTVSASQCYGLNWWALAGQTGYTSGSFKALNYHAGNAELPLYGNNPGNSTYHDDFGCGFTQFFTTAGQCQAAIPTIANNGDTLVSSPGALYQWYFNGAPIVSATDSLYIITQYGNYSVQVFDSLNGCSNISAPYVLPCSSTAPAITVHGDTLISSPGSAYQWYKEGQAIAGATDSVYILTGYGDYFVQVGGSAFTCSNASAVYSVSCQSVVPVITTYGDTLVSSVGTGCQWYFNGNPVSGATDSVYIMAQYGSYWVETAGSGFSCSRVSTPVSVPCQSTIPIITRSGSLLIASPGTGYQWYYDDTLIPGATDSSFLMAGNGSYSVQVINSGFGCTLTSAPDSVQNVGIVEVPGVSPVYISPNPSKESFTLTVGSELLGAAYSLSDMTGRLMLNGNITSVATSISVSGLATGVYILNIEGQNKRSFKVMKD